MSSKTVFNVYMKSLNIKVLSILTLLAIYIFNDSLDIRKISFFLYTSILYLAISIIMNNNNEAFSLHLLLIDSALTYFTIINYIMLAVSILGSISDIMRASFLIYGLVIMNQAIIIKFSKYILSSNELVLGFLINNMLRYIFYRNLELLSKSLVILLFVILCYMILLRKKHIDVKYVIPCNMLSIFTVFFMDKSSIIFWCIFILTALTTCIIENFGEKSRYSDIRLIVILLANTLVAMLCIISRINYTYLFNTTLLLIYTNILLKILSEVFDI